MPLGRLDHHEIPAEAWLAFRHEPAPEPAHAARSGDAAPAGPPSASPSAPAPKARRRRECDRDPRPRGGCGHRWHRGGSRLWIVVRPRLSAAGGDRSELVRVRSQRFAPRLDPRGEEPRARHGSGHVPLGPQGDDRHRGQALLRARRARCRRHRARRRGRHQGRRARRGWIDDHPAARPEPLHLAREDRSAQGERGVPRLEARRRVVEAADPDRVPQSELLRQPRVRHRGGGADVLLEAGEGPHALRVRAHRRAAPGSVDLRPVHGAVPRARATAGGARGHARHGGHRPADLPQGARREDRVAARAALRRNP